MQSFEYLMLVVVAQSVVQMACGVKNSTCPECGGGDWRRLEDEPFCYQLSKSNKNKASNFSNLWKYCKNLDANLPILKTNSSRDNLKNFALPIALDNINWVFIGLVNNKSKWMWVDGTPFTESFFYGIQLSSTNGYIIYLGFSDQTYGQYDQTIETIYRYCQKKCPFSTTTTTSSSTPIYKTTAQVPKVTSPELIEGPALSSSPKQETYIVQISIGLVLACLLGCFLCISLHLWTHRTNTGLNPGTEPSHSNRDGKPDFIACPESGTSDTGDHDKDQLGITAVASKSHTYPSPSACPKSLTANSRVTSPSMELARSRESRGASSYHSGQQTTPKSMENARSGAASAGPTGSHTFSAANGNHKGKSKRFIDPYAKKSNRMSRKA